MLHRGFVNVRVISLLLVTIVMCCIFTFIAIDLPYSALYKPYHDSNQTKELANKFNDIRLEKAYQYWSQVKDSLKFYSSKNRCGSELVVCVITTSRDNRKANLGYLIQNTAVIDKLVKSDVYFDSISTFVCNVDKNPTSHSEAVFLQEHMPYVQRFGSNNLKIKVTNSTAFHAHNKVKTRSKETDDYVFCLNVSLSYMSTYVLVLQDDVLSHLNMLQVIHYTLTKLQLQNTKNKGSPFSFLKLYYPERWQGYAFEPDRILELFCVGVLGGAFVLVLMTLCSKSRYKYTVQLSIFVMGMLLTILIASVIGRQNIIEIRRTSPQLYKLSPSPTCCIPAMLYVKSVIPNMIKYVMSHSDRNIDIGIHDYIDKHSVPGYQLEPNLVHHLGMYTSLQNAYKPAEEFLFDMPSIVSD